ncbi:hypothetical protein J0K78_06330 [Halobacillus sp. GSS1]|uniref:hypothetical protein n=1 Tax=Halobacillus sp. GSS1 TaxID=2815919 RepID=UPI001A8CE2F9|nr:hypothetical protein [Halobacillus sp. GSS1]MBN9653877.1 hypothetical protein [Halobacillus sp. GSS1]
MANDLFYSNKRQLIGSTDERTLIRNIKRSNKAKTWKDVGRSWDAGVKQSDRNATYLYLIPAKERRKAERFFGVTARKLD